MTNRRVEGDDNLLQFMLHDLKDDFERYIFARRAVSPSRILNLFVRGYSFLGHAILSNKNEWVHELITKYQVSTERVEYYGNPSTGLYYPAHYLAVRVNNIQALQVLVDLRVRLDLRYYYLQNILVCIQLRRDNHHIYPFNFTAIRMLIESGVSVDEDAARKFEPILFEVIRNCNLEEVQFFITRRISLTALNHHKESPLHICAETPNTDVFKALIDAGIRMTKDKFLRTPLMKAAMIKNKKMVDFILENEYNKLMIQPGVLESELEAVHAYQVLGCYNFVQDLEQPVCCPFFELKVIERSLEAWTHGAELLAILEADVERTPRLAEYYRTTKNEQRSLPIFSRNITQLPPAASISYNQDDFLIYLIKSFNTINKIFGFFNPLTQLNLICMGEKFKLTNLGEYINCFDYAFTYCTQQQTNFNHLLKNNVITFWNLPITLISLHCQPNYLPQAWRLFERVLEQIYPMNANNVDLDIRNTLFDTIINILFFFIWALDKYGSLPLSEFNSVRIQTLVNYTIPMAERFFVRRPLIHQCIKNTMKPLRYKSTEALNLFGNITTPSHFFPFECQMRAARVDALLIVLKYMAQKGVDLQSLDSKEQTPMDVANKYFSSLQERVINGLTTIIMSQRHPFGGGL